MGGVLSPSPPLWLGNNANLLKVPSANQVHRAQRLNFSVCSFSRFGARSAGAHLSAPLHVSN